MAIDRSQFVSATGNNVSSLSAVFSSLVTSGSLLVIFNAFFHNAGQTFTTVTDNVVAAGFTARANSTMVSDTTANLLCHEKLNLSSGAAASTYRISVNYSAGVNTSVWAGQYTGGTFTFGSTGSSNGTSSSPRGPVQTASSTPVLFVSGAIHNSAGTLFATTAATPSIYVTTVDAANANQVINVIESTNSSLSQQPTHSLTTSTRWLAVTVMYTGQTVAGGAATGQPWHFTMLGVQ